MRPGALSQRNPFIAGGPIKNPRDFFGREEELRRVFDRIEAAQSVSLIGEHRCGNTSLLYQLCHPEVQRRYGCGEDLIFVYLNCQQGFRGMSGFYRAVLDAIEYQEPDISFKVGDRITNSRMGRCVRALRRWGKRLVLLLDDFESMAHLQVERLRWLAQKYDVSFVTSTKEELSKYCSRGRSSPFFNIFVSVRLGPFKEDELGTFLRVMSGRSGLPLEELRGEIQDLSGGFPYFVQLVCYQLFELVRHEGYGALDRGLERLRSPFADAAREHFEDVWLTSLDEAERAAAVALAWGHKATDEEALKSLREKGYGVDDRLFSSAFAEFVRGRHKRIQLDETAGLVWVEGELVHLSPKEYELLAYVWRHERQVISKDELWRSVWPDYGEAGVDDGLIQQTVSRLRKRIERDPRHPRHILTVRGRGYRFVNE